MNHEASFAEPVAVPVIAAAPPKSLRANTSWMLVGNVVYAACQAGWLVLISKMSSTESRGRFVLAMAIATPIIAFANFGLRAMLATDVRREHNFSVYFALRLFSTAVAFIVIACIALTQHQAAAWVLVVVGLAKSIELVSDIVWGRMQQFERFDRIAVAMTLKGAASLGCLALGLKLTHDSLGAVGGIALGFLLTLLLYDLPTLRGIAPSETQPSPRPLSLGKMVREWRRRAPPMWELVRQAAPLAFASSLVLLNANFVIYFIPWHFGAAQAEPMVGVFGAFSNLIAVGMILVAAVGVATSPRLAVHYSEGDSREFHRLLLRLLLVCAAIGVAGIALALVAGRPIIELLFKPEDAEHSSVLVWLMVSGAIAYLASILGYAVTATRQFHRFTIPYLGVTVVGVIASALLIPKYGLEGAAWASAVMNVASCAAPVFILARLHFESIYEPAS